MRAAATLRSSLPTTESMPVRNDHPGGDYFPAKLATSQDVVEGKVSHRGRDGVATVGDGVESFSLAADTNVLWLRKSWGGAQEKTRFYSPTGAEYLEEQGLAGPVYRLKP